MESNFVESLELDEEEREKIAKSWADSFEKNIETLIRNESTDYVFHLGDYLPPIDEVKSEIRDEEDISITDTEDIIVKIIDILEKKIEEKTE
ncbi:MAG: hypothetical protein ACOCP8_02190 [archaeon]